MQKFRMSPYMPEINLIEYVWGETHSEMLTVVVAQRLHSIAYTSLKLAFASISART